MWVASLGWLGARQASSHVTPDLAAGTDRLPPGAVYFTVRLADRQIGLASLTIDTVPGGIRITERLDVTVPEAGGTRRVLVTAASELSEDLRLQRFHTTWSGTAERLVAAGALEGDSLLILEMADSAGAAPERIRVPVRGVLTTTAAVPLRLAFGRGLGTGATASVLALDPMRLTLEPLRAVVAAESVFVVTDSAAIDPATGEWTPALLDTLLGWRIVEAGGRASRWVDAEGYPLSARTTEGLALERSAFEIVNSAYRADRADSVWISRGLRPRGVLARAPRPARMPLVADSGFALAGDPAIGGALRRWQGDTLQLGTAADTSPSRPAPTDRSAGPFVPSEDARVAAQARRVIGRLRGEAAVSQLMDWVVTEVALDERGPTGALAALEQHRGTAEAKVALFTALARAAGFPARLVGGVALGADGHWYRHTWSEVLLRGAWVGADPVFGRYPADAAYVRLTTGRPGHVLAVDPIAARLTPLSEPR